MQNQMSDYFATARRLKSNKLLPRLKPYAMNKSQAVFLSKNKT